MTKLYGLNDDDKRVLKKVVQWFRGGGAGKSSRPTPTRRRHISVEGTLPAVTQEPSSYGGPVKVEMGLVGGGDVRELTNYAPNMCFASNQVWVRGDKVVRHNSARFLSLKATQDAPVDYDDFQDPLDGGGSDPSFPFAGTMGSIEGLSVAGTSGSENRYAITLIDRNSVLPDVNNGDHVVFAVHAHAFADREAPEIVGQLHLVVVETPQTAGGGGGDPYDPCDETTQSGDPARVFGYNTACGTDLGWYELPDSTTLVLVSALVNEASHVVAGASFNFDGATVLAGSPDPAPTSGTATNNISVPLLDNQPVLLMQEDGGSWRLMYAAQNIIKAQVNVSGGVDTTDATFAFDNGSKLRGHHVTSGTAVNEPRSTYYNNEEVILFLKDDLNWQPLYRSDQELCLIKGSAQGAVSGTASTLVVDGLTAIKGRLPRAANGTLLSQVTAQNLPKCKFANNDTVYLTYGASAGTDESDSWTTDSTKNIEAILRARTDYDDTAGVIQVLAHEGDEDTKWLEAKFLELEITTS